MNDFLGNVLRQKNTAVANKLFKEYDAEFTQISKMEIESYDSKRRKLDSRKVNINPESYARSFSSKTGKTSKPIPMADGQAYVVKEVEFVETLKFDLWFDDTGVIPSDPKSRGLVSDLAWLQKNLVEYYGEIHATPYIKILWGSLNFYGQLKNLSIDYTYFSQDGVPLRAKAGLVCEQVVEGIQTAKVKKSPDLTHLRTVQAGDTLPLMCYRIYNDPQYYLKVAEANGLPHFTNIKPGQKLYFPPLK